MTGLTKAGLAFLGRISTPTSGRSSGEVVLLGPLNGVSSMKLAWSNSGLGCAAHLFIGCDEGARRVAESEWPDSMHHGDLNNVGKAEVLEWRRLYPSKVHVVSVAGFPVQDLFGQPS